MIENKIDGKYVSIYPLIKPKEFKHKKLKKLFDRAPLSMSDITGDCSGPLKYIKSTKES